MLEGFIMDNTIIAPATVDISGYVAEARRALVQGIGKTGELIEGYANALTKSHGKAWYELVGKDAKGIRIERETFNAEMSELKKLNGSYRYPKLADGKYSPSLNTMWQRVKEAAGYVTADKVSGSTSNSDRNLADLKTIINRILADEENSVVQNWSDSKGSLMGIFTAHGGDIGKLGQ
jgi:hypothetical protein